MDTFDFREPKIYVHGAGTIDCREQMNFALLAPVFSGKGEILDAAAHAALEDFPRNVKRSNPHSQVFSPLKWTAWNTGYWFWMKHFYARAPAAVSEPRQMRSQVTSAANDARHRLSKRDFGCAKCGATLRLTYGRKPPSVCVICGTPLPP
jgi:hypothetical protein